MSFEWPEHFIAFETYCTFVVSGVVQFRFIRFKCENNCCENNKIDLWKSVCVSSNSVQTQFKLKIRYNNQNSQEFFSLSENRYISAFIMWGNTLGSGWVALCIFMIIFLKINVLKPFEIVYLSYRYAYCYSEMKFRGYIIFFRWFSSFFVSTSLFLINLKEYSNGIN